jgi:hypothetical protein
MNLIDKSINIQISPNISILLPLNQKKKFIIQKILKKKTKHTCFLKETVNFK